MRRAVRTAVGVAACAVLAVGCAQAGPVSSPTGTPTPAASASSGTPSAIASASSSGAPSVTTASGTCAALVAGMTLEQQAGQLVMAGVKGGLDATERRAIADKGIGSVILADNSTAGVAATRDLTGEIAALAGPAGVLVATDQEGGLVQRLKGSGFDTIPSAVRQAGLGADDLTSEAAKWGGQLREAGVRMDLAPVADVVPASKVDTNEPIGKLNRGYGSDPEGVGEDVAAFVAGMRKAGVATSVKHFPGLGQVVGNTDTTAGVTDSVTVVDDAGWAPFRAGLAAGAETAMVSTAVYTRIDADNPAAFSPTVLGLVRSDLGFAGVVVSDDMGGAVSVRDVPAAERLTRFVGAGGDLAISVYPNVAAAMVDGLVETAGSDAALRDRVAESARRVVDLKGSLGIASCTPAGP